MSEAVEYFQGMKQHDQEQRALLRQAAPETLKKLGVFFTSHNDGAHLIVSGGKGKKADFWPGSHGKYRMRGRTKNGYGIVNMLKELGVTGCGS